MAYAAVEETAKTRGSPAAYFWFVLLVLATGSISYGYTAAIIGTTLGQPSFIHYFQLATRANASAIMGSFNGVFQAGGVVGTLLLPVLADRYGRKVACIVPSLVIIISQALLAGSVNVAMFIVFRFFAGFGCYATAAIVPIMLSEMVPAQVRGKYVDIVGAALNIGYASAGWLGYGFAFWEGNGSSNAWRIPLAIGIFPPLVFLVGILTVLPESPRWLCMKGRESEAEAVLLRLHKSASDPNNDFARAEFFQIRSQLQIDGRLDNSWYRLFTKKSYRKRAGIAILTMFTTQTSGVLLITNYAPLLFSTLGLGVHTQLFLLALVVTIGVLENGLAMLIVDRFNRPKYIAVGMMGCVASFATEAALVARYAGSTNENALRAGVAMIYVFAVFYSFAIDGPQFCYLTEIFPSHLRAKGVSLGVATFSLTNIIWLQAAPTAFASIGWKFYLCMVVPGFLLSLVMWFFFPDTRGKPLEEIAAIFGDNDEIAVLQADLEIDIVTHEIRVKDDAMRKVDELSSTSATVGA